MDLTKKTLAVIGGSGYVGQAVARQALNFGLRVICVSRSGKPKPSLNPLANILQHAQTTSTTSQAQQSTATDQLHKAEWVRGDASDLNDSVKQVLAESDFTVFTIGTLIDSSVLKGRTPGEPGTYEHLNRDTAISVGTYLNSLNANKKIVYLSASRAPPLLPRYLSTKQEAEEFLLSQKSLRATILRPGFIYSAQHRVWSIPIKYEIDLWHWGFGYFYKNLVPENSLLKRKLAQLDQDRSIDLSDVALSAVITALNARYDGQCLSNEQMEEVRRTYEIKGSPVFQ